MKKLILALAMVAMLITPAFAIEGDAVKLTNVFPMASVSTETVTCPYIWLVPCDINLSAIEVVTPTTSLVGGATDTIKFRLYDDGTAIQEYNLHSGLLTADTPKAWTLTAATKVIDSGSVIKVAAVAVGTGTPVVTPIVTIHYAPTK